MPRAFRAGLVGLAMAGVVAATVTILTGLDLDPRDSSSRGRRRAADRPSGGGVPEVAKGPTVPLYSAGFVDDSGFDVAALFTQSVPERPSLADLYASRRDRVAGGLSVLQGKLDRLPPEDRSTEAVKSRYQIQLMIALLMMHDGRFDEAADLLERSLRETLDLPEDLRANTRALIGVAHLRRGEVENCVACLGPASCIFPLVPEAVHRLPDGSRAAMRDFTAYLDRRPDDLGVRWLLNVAAMTIGAYPDSVPPQYRLPLGRSGSSPGIGRFVNVATTAGLDSRGPNMLGGSICDDFTGDGLPDILITSGDWDVGASLFVNLGGGRFEDRGASWGLADQRMSENASQADFDGDGRLDVVLTRGGWQAPCRLSLLRNTGAGFEDVTVAAGLAEPIATQCAAWADYDNDGDVDLYLPGELRERGAYEPRNRSRLYRNNGDGTFSDVATEAGVTNDRLGKGACWGDYDGDGDPDLYVSNMNGPNRLYRNDGDGRFTDVAPDLGVTGPEASFSCWFWDDDDDGRLDLFVTGFHAHLGDLVADLIGRPAEGERPRLYRNLGPDGFRDVAPEMGLDHVWLPMGSNFADVDNDGWLDIYLGTGRPPYSVLAPNVMLRNAEGRRFDDVTFSSGTGHLQKGHGVSFADLDRDGDLDLVVQVGGQTPGDRAHNALFANPGHGRHWLALRLVGSGANRAAIGAEIRADVLRPDGSTRTLHRVVGGGSSFGGNSLVVWLGLGAATKVENVTITWPGSRTVQSLGPLPCDQSFLVEEGTEPLREGAPPPRGGAG